MAKKTSQNESAERKPDLAGPDYSQLEENVRQLMEPESKAKSIPVIAHDETVGEEPSTAPELGAGEKKKTKIKIVHHEDSEELKAAIEQANQELMAKTGETAETIDVGPPEEPAKMKDLESETTAEPESEAAVETEEAEETKVAEPEPTEVPETENNTSNEATETQDDTPEMSEEVESTEVDEADAPEVDEAVEDIVRAESDASLQAQDEAIEKAFDDKKPSFRSRLKQFFINWWTNPIARWLSILVIVGGLVTAGVAPASRYFLLNTFGARSSTSLTVFDESTLQPLKNVTVKLGSTSSKTDDAGKVSLSQLRLGPAELVVEKRAYGTVAKKITIGWGSNPLGEFKLKPTGAQYEFVLADFVSKQPITKAELTSGEASTLVGEKGQAKLTVDKMEAENDMLEVTVTAEGYRQEKITVKTDTKQPTPVKLVPARGSVFVSKRSGKYDVYKIDVDGKNETKLLAGTGVERDDMVLSVHPEDDWAALVSTRQNKRNKDGFLLSDLTLINVRDGSAKQITESEKIQIVGWIDGRLIYVQVKAGTSAANPERNRLISYDFREETSKDLATSNYFNDTLVIGDKVYYAPSAAYAGGTASKLYQSNADGSAVKTIYDSEAWNLLRTAYDTLSISTPDSKWQEFKLGDSKVTQLPGAPAITNSHVFVDSPDGKQSLWVDNRDGKGVLLLHDVGTGEDKEVKTQSGLKYPVRWLNSTTVLYRIQTDQESADYVVSLNGGDPIKVKDVTNIASVDSWYYY